MTDKILLDVLKGKNVNRMPVWLMRQAGRYLPEYRRLREKAGSFLGLCLNADLAAMVALQPVSRFELDAAILFSDILMVPYGLGQQLEFREKEGPFLEPVTPDNIKNLVWKAEKLEPVFGTMERMKQKLPGHVARLGFAGGLWTVACYMVEGRGKSGFSRVMKTDVECPGFMDRLMDILNDATLEYIGRQIEAGAEAIQLFDSWAGLLKGKRFRKRVLEPTKALIEALKKEYPGVPVIGFPRGARLEDYKKFRDMTGVDALGLDQNVSVDYARAALKGKIPLQGNLDPELLVTGGDKMKESAAYIMDRLGPDHIFNLGHGIRPETPPGNVAGLVDFLRARQRQHENSRSSV